MTGLVLARLGLVRTLADGSQLKSIVVKPDPPVPGQNLTVTVEADVQSVIEVSDWLQTISGRD